MLTTTLILIFCSIATAAAGVRPPSWRAWKLGRWYADAICIHHHEARRWDTNTGNGYYGGMQFLLSTWQRVGGRGYPYQWPAREQLYRARLVWKQDGGSWREWGTARVCGAS